MNAQSFKTQFTTSKEVRTQITNYFGELLKLKRLSFSDEMHCKLAVRNTKVRGGVGQGTFRTFGKRRLC